MFNPNGLSRIAVPYILMPEGSDSDTWLFPFKKALRDTKINQLTFYVEALAEGALLECKVCLYRCVDSLVDIIPLAGRIVAEKVDGSEVSALGLGAILQNSWIFTNGAIDIQGGTYWIAVTIQSTNLYEEAIIFANWTFVGVTDADPLILYPKYDVALATPMTFPTTINITAMTDKTDYWFYASGEYY